jgi:hypothetical protein
MNPGKHRNVAKLASPEEHELAGRLLHAKELCLDLARKHTSAIAQSLTRSKVRNHYEAIAKSLYCCRVKRRSLFQQVMLNKAVEQFLKSRHEEERLDEDLLVASEDPHYSVDRRRAALHEIDELRKQSEELAEHQHTEVVKLSISPSYRPPRSQRLISRLRKDGRDKFFDKLDSIVRRYLNAKLEGTQWAVSTPATRLTASVSLLQLIALEWLRDQEELWRFLEACLSRWEAVTNPTGMHQQNIMMHNICETGMALDVNGNNVIDPNQKILPQVAVLMQDVGASVEPNQSAVDRLRQRSSRNIRKAKAEFKTNRV